MKRDIHEVASRLKSAKPREYRQAAMLALKLWHYLATLTIFFIAWLLFRYHTLSVHGQPDFRYNYFVTFGYALLLYFFYRTYNSFLLGYYNVAYLIASQFFSQLISICIVYALVTFTWRQFKNPLIFLAMLACQLVLDISWAFAGDFFYFKVNGTKSTILIYRTELDKKRFGTITGKPSERMFRIDKELQYEGHSFRDIRDQLEGFDAVCVAGVHSLCRNGILKYCKEEAIPGFFLPRVGDVIMQEARHIKSFDSPVLFVSRSVPKPEYKLIKRLFDIAASALGLILLSPFILVTALAVHFYDGGPAIYKQKRLTKDGRVFEIYKFRSMRVDAEKDGVARFSTGDNDDRITPIGKLIRKVRFDELPQLWNILRGDMSIVGPRPERPEIAAQFYEYLPSFQLRLQVKAGLTGYAQVYGRYNSDPYEKLEFDLLYINNMSVLTDLMLMFATAAILFSRNSTQGFTDARENLSSEEIKDYDALEEKAETEAETETET